MQKHSPLPFKTLPGMPVYIADAAGVKILQPLANTGMSVEEYRANAELAVLAINAHAELATTLQSLLDYVVRNGHNYHGPVTLGEVDSVKRARAVLAEIAL